MMDNIKISVANLWLLTMARLKKVSQAIATMTDNLKCNIAHIVISGYHSLSQSPHCDFFQLAMVENCVHWIQNFRILRY